MKPKNIVPIQLSDYAPYPYKVEDIYLEINLDWNKTIVNSTINICKNKPAVTSLDEDLILNARDLELLEISMNDKALKGNDYILTDEALIIKHTPSDTFTLKIKSACNPKANTRLSGLYLTNELYCTQCEAEGFRAITYYPDRPDVLSKFKVKIIGNKKTQPILLSNGNLIEEGDLANNKHYAIWEDPHPKPSYLFALVAGDFEHIESDFITMSNKKVKLRIFVEKGKKKRAHFALEALKKSMKWDEDIYQREYDLDLFMVVAVSNFNSGAMENKGLNIFNDLYLLASPETATDTNFEHIEAVVAHEYFHNWTGNRITCRDWFQLCLKEGLTVFRDQEFSADQMPRVIKRISDVRGLRSNQFTEDASPLSHPVRPSSYITIRNFYTSTVYEKGAEVIRMLTHILGYGGFYKGMNLYFETHDGQAVTVEDFITCFEKANNFDLSQFMLWYTQAGTPELLIQKSYKASKKTYVLKITQLLNSAHNAQKNLPMIIPIKLGLMGSDGKDLELITEDGTKVKDGLIILKDKTETFHFANIKEKPVLSILREFSAPVKLNYKQNKKEQFFQAMHDADQFNRWQAVQDYALDLAVSMIESLNDNRQLRQGRELANLLKNFIQSNDISHHFIALSLTLPNYNNIAAKLAKNINPDKIGAVISHMHRSIYNILHDDFHHLLKEIEIQGTYSFNPDQVGKRALKNTIMNYIKHSQNPKDTRFLYEQYLKATNMTDSLSALKTLTKYPSSLKDKALSDFYNKWEDDNLILDDWFGLQASSDHYNALDDVINLTKHQKFSLNNPNRARSLIGIFAFSNPTKFNAMDGSGYDFITDYILKIDKINQELAARFANSFRSFATLEEQRKLKAKLYLQKIAKTKNISTDLHEIVEKILLSDS